MPTFDLITLERWSTKVTYNDVEAPTLEAAIELVKAGKVACDEHEHTEDDQFIEVLETDGDDEHDLEDLADDVAHPCKEPGAGDGADEANAESDDRVWRPDDISRAWRDGWGVFRTDGQGPLHIERIDEHQKFESDEEAHAHVVERAKTGSGLGERARKALRLIDSHAKLDQEAPAPKE